MNKASILFFRVLMCSIGMLLSAAVIAQPGSQSQFDQTQVVTGDRTLDLQQAFKISDMPVPAAIEIDMDSMDYIMIPRRPPIAVSIDTIAPAKVKVREPLDQLYRGFVRGGVGTFATPLLEAWYTSLRDRDLAYGLHVKHLSANDGVNRPVAYSGFSQNMASAWVKKIVNQHALEAKLGYNRRVNYYYGFDPGDRDIAKDDIRQRFNDLSLQGRWESYYRDSSRINHAIDLDLYSLSDLYGAGEFGLSAKATLKSFRGEQFYHLDAGFDLISYRSDTLRPFAFMDASAAQRFLPEVTNTNAIVHADPKIVLTRGDLRVVAGLALYGQFSTQARFHAFPDVSVSYALFDNILVPYAGIDGKVARTSYRSLSTQNPYLLSNLTLINRVVRYNLYGGIKGSLSDHLSFDARLAYTKTDDTPLYVNDTLLSIENRLAVVYDQVRTFTLGGELSYKATDKLRGRAFAQFYRYDTDQEDEAWHLPKFTIGTDVRYNLFDKLYTELSLSWIGSRPVKSLLPVADIAQQAQGHYIVELDPYLDLGLKLEYQYTSRLSAFVQANNLTASRYDIYYRFPAQRVFVLGGLQFKF